MSLATRISALLLALIMFVGVIGCNSNNNAATVNGEAVTKADLNKEVNRLKKIYATSGAKLDNDKARLAQMENQVLDQLIMKTIELQEAKKKNVLVSDEKVKNKIKEFENLYKSKENFQKMLKSQNKTLEQFTADIKYQLSREALFNAVTKDVKASNEDIQKYYNDNPKESAKYKVRTILVSTQGRSDADAKAIAEGLANQLAKGVSFEQLAKTKSEDTVTKNNGGLMVNPIKKDDYYLSKGQIGGEAEFALANLKAGEYTKKPVRNNKGYLLLKVDEIKQMSLEEAKNIFSSRILQMKKFTTYNDYIKGVKAKAKIKILVNNAEKKKSGK